MDKEISQAVIARLPRYFRYLGELKDSGGGAYFLSGTEQAHARDRIPDTSGL